MVTNINSSKMKLYFAVFFLFCSGCFLDNEAEVLNFDGSLEEEYVEKKPLGNTRIILQPYGERVMQFGHNRDTILTWERYESSKNGISFSLPVNWKLSSNDSTLVLFTNELRSNEFFSITANAKSDSLVSVESYFQLLKNELIKDSFALLSASSYSNASRSIFQLDVVDDATSDDSFYILITESENYVFDFTMNFTNDRELSKSIFLNVMASVFFNESSLIGYGANLEEIEIGFTKN